MPMATDFRPGRTNKEDRGSAAATSFQSCSSRRLCSHNSQDTQGSMLHFCTAMVIWHASLQPRPVPPELGGGGPLRPCRILLPGDRHMADSMLDAFLRITSRNDRSLCITKRVQQLHERRLEWDEREAGWGAFHPLSGLDQVVGALDHLQGGALDLGLVPATAPSAHSLPSLELRFQSEVHTCRDAEHNPTCRDAEDRNVSTQKERAFRRIYVSGEGARVGAGRGGEGAERRAGAHWPALVSSGA